MRSTSVKERFIVAGCVVIASFLSAMVLISRIPRLEHEGLRRRRRRDTVTLGRDIPTHPLLFQAPLLFGRRLEHVVSSLHEAADELRDLISCGIEREVTRIEDVDLGLRYVSPICLGLRKLERQVVLAPEDE
jgi:hypothetical protein